MTTIIALHDGNTIHMTDIKNLAAMTALNSMMQSPFFNICTIHNVAELMGVNPKGEAYATLAVLHCIHWDKMPIELREAVPGLIQQCLGIAPSYVLKTLEQEVLDVAPARKFLRLFGVSK